MLEHMKVGQFTLRIRTLDDMRLPAYKGSTFRGGFGQALREVVCALRRQECESCLLRERCVFVYLFETPPPKDAEMMRLYPSAPHPFVIEPPDNDRTLIVQGESVDFGLVLIGRALEYLPYFIYAFIRLGERGLGRGRGKYVLEEVFASNGNETVPVYQKEAQILRDCPPYPASELIQKRVKSLGSGDSVTIDFMTPSRIKFDGDLVKQPDFHHLIRSLLRRMSSLSYFHCGHRLEIDFRGLIEQAKEVERVQTELRWHDWDRYSTRQKQRMTLGGVVGSAIYQGDISRFLTLLAWGEVVHVGKAASFGLGRCLIRRV
jgi:hypothetical protein